MLPFAKSKLLKPSFVNLRFWLSLVRHNYVTSKSETMQISLKFMLLLHMYYMCDCQMQIKATYLLNYLLTYSHSTDIMQGL